VRAHDLYAIKANSLRDAESLVDCALSICTELHDSLHHGGDYFRFGGFSGEEHFILQWNKDAIDDEPVEDSFRESSILLYIESTHRSEELRTKLSRYGDRVALLRHEDATVEISRDLDG
jgi:hypothetical protein